MRIWDAGSREISSALLVVLGENAHSRYLSEGVFEKLTGDDEELHLVRVPGPIPWAASVG